MLAEEAASPLSPLHVPCENQLSYFLILSKVYYHSRIMWETSRVFPVSRIVLGS